MCGLNRNDQKFMLFNLSSSMPASHLKASVLFLQPLFASGGGLKNPLVQQRSVRSLSSFLFIALQNTKMQTKVTKAR